MRLVLMLAELVPPIVIDHCGGLKMQNQLRIAR